MSYVQGNILKPGNTITGADLDAWFTLVLQVINGYLDGNNFSGDAGIQLVNRATKGNRLSVSGGLVQYSQGVGVATDSAVLADFGAPSEHLGIPSVYKLIEVGMCVQKYSRALVAGDHVVLQYRLYNTRTSAWGAWTSTAVDKPVAQTPTIDNTITLGVVGDKDYSKLQLRIEVDGAGVALDVYGVSVWASLEALHLP